MTEATREQYDQDRAIEYDDDWMCECGHFTLNIQDYCAGCGKKK